jgi:hypothetical protein
MINRHMRKHEARAMCTECGEIIVSIGAGHSVTCFCNSSSITQEEYSALYVKMAGAAELLGVKCPIGCPHQSHKTNPNYNDNGKRERRIVKEFSNKDERKKGTRRRD